MNVNKLLEDLILVQIDSNIFTVDHTLERKNFTNTYVGLDHIYSNSFLKEYHKNFIQLHHIGSSNLLHNFRLSNFEIENCNNLGLEIFLTEQIYFQCGPGDELPIADFVNLRIDIDFTEYPLYWQNCKYSVKSLELDSCRKFIKNNNLTNVTVHLCNKDPKQLLNHYNFSIGNKNPFLQAMFAIVKRSERKNTGSAEIKYKFWCGNWRYEPHRHIIAAYLSNYNTKLGWHFDGNAQSFEHFYWFKLQDWQHKYQKHYKKLVQGIENLNTTHYCIDVQPKKYKLKNQVIDVGLRPMDNGEHPIWQNQINENLYNDTFCSIINLGSFADCFPTYDEKPLLAIRNYRPFILVGPPGSLQMMKDHGFKTFDNFWDESYDLEQNHEKRFIKIFELINTIDSMSIDDCKIMYQSMKKILQHNYNVITKGLIQ